VEVAAIGFGGAVVLTEDLPEHLDAQPTRLIAGVITDTLQIVAGMIVAGVIVIVLAFVVRVSRSIGVVVEASHR
jgi:hypothetical protein